MGIAFVALIVAVIVVSACGIRKKHATRGKPTGELRLPPKAARSKLAKQNRESGAVEPSRKLAEAYGTGSSADARKARFASVMGIDRLQPCDPSSDETPDLWDESIRDRVMPLASGVAMRVRARAKLYRILTSPSLNADAMKQAILEDPELAGEILRTVNSPFYGLVQPVASLTRAILYLGHLEVRNIIWRLCMRETSGEDLTGEAQEAMDSLWNHSFIVSRGSYAIAKNLGVGDPDHIATAALLHDIGKSLFLRLEPSEYAPMMRSRSLEGGELRRAEQSLFGCDHARLGFEVAKMWGLPDKITKLVEKHHYPDWAPAGEGIDDSRSLMVVYVADLLHHASHSSREEESVCPIHAPADGWIKLLGLKVGLEELYSEQLLRIYAADAAAAAQNAADAA